ncbi:integrase, catalytic region, zinc finger, CCHC-type containing protein [Tanacetum coccineum]
MSTQQDIYAAGSENCPPMLTNGDYVLWSSRLLLSSSFIFPELFHDQSDDGNLRMQEINKGSDDQAIKTILLALIEDIYATDNSCETAQEIWLRVQQMIKGSDIGIQEKKAKFFNEWERFTSTNGESIESYYHHAFRIRGVQNVGNQNGVIVVLGIAHQNGNGNVVAARAEGNANGNNGNQIRCYNCRGLGHLARNLPSQGPMARDAAYLQTQLLIAQKEEAGIRNTS